MSLWLAAAPLAVTYAITARKVGLNPLETQVMSLTIYSAPTQLGIVQLWSAGAPALTVLLMALVMNLHQLLYGLSLAGQVTLSHRQRALGALFLTDAVYGVTIAAGKNAVFDFLFGAEVSLYLVWNGSTALGVRLGHRVMIPSSVPLDFVVPLTFLALLVSTVKTRIDVGVVFIAAAVAALCLSVQVGASTILLAALAGALAGVWMERTRRAVSGANRP